MNTRQFGPLLDIFNNVLVILDGGTPDEVTREFRWILQDFDVNKADLKADHTDRLDMFLDSFLLPHPEATWIVDIIGRASQTDTDAHNLALGYDRAQTVRSYLLGHGVSDYRVPQARSEGMRVPYIDNPGSEEPLNRSVEIVWRWQADLVLPPPGYDPTASARWHLNLKRSWNVGFILGLTRISGELTKRLPSGDETKDIIILVAGLDVSGPLPVALSVTTSPDGFFELDRAVNWDWFDGQYVAFASGEAGAGGGANASCVRIGWLNGVNVWMRSTGIGTPTVGGFLGAGFMNVLGV